MAEERTREEELAENIRQSVELADKIFEVVSNPKYVGETTPETRYAELNKRYPTFAQHYPVCLRQMCHGKYSRKAFLQFLERQRKEPGKGMDGFIERQCDYAKFLYIEDSKSRTGHYSTKIAGKVWTEEHRMLREWVKKIKKDEEESKNAYDEEQKRHRVQRQRELLDFINTQSPPLRNEDAILPETAEIAPEEKSALTEVAPSIAELDDRDMSMDELREMLVELRKYEIELIDMLTNANTIVHRLEAEHSDELILIDEPISESSGGSGGSGMAAVKTNKPPAKRRERGAERRQVLNEVDRVMRELGLNDTTTKAVRKRQ